MVREPSDILGDMNDRLSSRELQLVLVYFSQQGRDLWCALEVFEWLKKENKVDIQTMDLMVSIKLKPGFSMVDKVISMYWEMEKEETVLFVKNVLSTGIEYEDDEGEKGGQLIEGDYMDACSLVVDLKESGLNPEIYSYLIAMTAIVKELNDFAKALRRLSKWAIKEGNPSLHGSVHERLLSMYICTGQGLEAERQLWEMKLAVEEASGELYDIVLSISASQRETSSISRLLTIIEVSSCQRRRKTLSWLLRGYVKGGQIVNAAGTVIKMVDMGLTPEYLDGVAVLQELRKRIQRPGKLY
ncbi:ethylene-overproduction protein 1-like [Hibiscus syriacus]|uniref:Ethylene-overproduction protein 1-like n=1 Tax=Hibiscus syriacus TaxID=106335 RepID=A0A6A2WZT0_HIBSY|nr:ethylene-overproduction protein 1-like [Hibiscus syriacus]